MGDGVEFTVLGPVEAWHDGSLVPLGGYQRRGVLAVLLLHVGQVVPLDRLVELVWADDPPLDVRSAVRMHVSRLRYALARDPEVAIAAHRSGYVLRVAPRQVDVHRFRHLVAQARAASEPCESRRLLADALRLWRGTPLADLASDQLRQRLGSGLVEERLAALEERLRLDLRLGHHEEIVVELTELAVEHPLRERFTELRMLALSRCGRQADALTVYDQIRRSLAEELGIDPGAELRRLHRAILRDDRALTAVRPVTTMPHQLPAPVRDFVGRNAELTALTRLAEDAVGSMAIAVLAGGIGVGKTALALHWAYQATDDFRDGQLYVNLRGFDPSGAPTTPAEAIRMLLDGLRVPAEQVPVSLDAQAGLYRSLTAGCRMLILLDNARDSAQVRPLLPGASSCLVLVTSRNHLTGLVTGHGARHLPVGVLPDVEARALLAARLGVERVASEPAAVTELVASCGGLPLALTIVAGRAHPHPHLSLSTLAGELREAGRDILPNADPAGACPACRPAPTRP